MRADPIASLVIAAMILPRALLLLRDAAVVLLEIAPPGLDLDDVRRHLSGTPGVVDVHDLHAWTITSGMPSLSAHVTVTDEALADRGVGGDPRRALPSASPSTSGSSTRRSRSSRRRTGPTRTSARRTDPIGSLAVGGPRSPDWRRCLRDR